MITLTLVLLPRLKQKVQSQKQQKIKIVFKVSKFQLNHEINLNLQNSILSKNKDRLI